VPHHEAAAAATATAHSADVASSASTSSASSSNAYGSWRAFQPVSVEYAERHLHLAQAPNFDLPVHTLLAPLPASARDEASSSEDSHLSAAASQSAAGSAELQVK